MNTIVLVKQVPDTKHIPEDAWDGETGTLRRALLENVCNPLDQQALALAFELRRESPGKVVALTMGPPFAAEVLRYALSLGADSGVLLTDRRLGGADTPATAYPLARAIDKIGRELFGGDADHLILAGLQSVDGDTAQVPPQVAEELGIAHVGGVTGYFIDPQGVLHFRRAIPGGTETVALERYPCLVTLREWVPPPYPTFVRTRWAYSRPLLEWDAKAIGADPSRIGPAGSRTAVVKIFPARTATHRPCRMVRSTEELVRLLKKAYGARNGRLLAKAAGPGYRLPGDKCPEYRGGIWIYAEQEDGELNPAAFELLGKARQLAEPLGEKVGAVLTGVDSEPLAPELIARGADQVIVADHERLARFQPGPCTRALVPLLEQHKPQIFLFSATPPGRELAPRVAYAMRSGLTADCTELCLTDLKRGSRERVGILLQTRPALGGNIMASIVSQNSRIQMSTARPGVFEALAPDRSRTGQIIRFTPCLGEADELGVRVCSVERKPSPPGLADAAIIVAGGIGCRTRDNFERYVGSLAQRMEDYFGGTAMAGASRQAVEAGFIDRSRQVGQTGQTVSPRLYLALGISGAVQHLSGIEGAGIVAAIDRDPAAPIFRACDYGLVGDLDTVVPELLAQLKTWKYGEIR